MMNREKFFFNSKKISQKFKILAPTKSKFNLVNLNAKRLAFLPSLFVTGLILLAFISAFVYFNFWGIFDRTPQIARVQDKILITKTQVDIDLKEGKTDTIFGNESLVDNSKDKFININQLGLNCKLNYPKTFDLPVVPVIIKDQQSWWFPEVNKCFDSNLEAIQIIQLGGEEGNNLKSMLNPVNIFLISEKEQIYALAYTKNKQISGLDLSVIGENLLSPVFTSAQTFNSTKMFDAKIISENTIYLSSGCQPKNAENNCTIWKQDQYSGTVYKLKNNFFQDIKTTTFDKNTSYVKFAKKQDSTEQVNIITGKINSSEYWLIKLSILNNTVSTVTQIDLGDKVYNEYYR